MLCSPYSLNMTPSAWYITLTGLSLLAASSCVSAFLCEVSLPQDSNGPCTAIRNADLAKDRELYTLAVDESLHGFARVNMSISQLAQVIQTDPFIRRYATDYITMIRASDTIFEKYNSTYHDKEINDLSDYLPLSQYFQLAPEQALGEMARLPSRYEDALNNKEDWIKDRYFAQQRLAGINPKSLRRVSIQGERKCTVKTDDGRWCHFPFKYNDKIYHSCTKAGHDKPWCATTKDYDRDKRWGECNGNKDKNIEESKDCSIKTEHGEWCHFPFVFKGVKYESCIKTRHHRSWCATKPAYYWRGWGYCAGNEKEDEGAIGLDWNELEKTLNAGFDWDQAVRDAFQDVDGVSMKEAIKQRRIYVLRYEECDNLPRSEDTTDNDPRRKMWDFFSPIALFVSVPSGQKNELVPVAIQMDHKPDSDVFTPKDGNNWLLAKYNLQITDIGYVQIAEHLAKSHYFMEPFCVCLKRNLADLHPLNQILKYHCREITIPNVFGTPALVAEERFMDLLFAYGNTGAVKLLRDAHPTATWEITDFVGSLKKRGVYDKDVLPYFPYRDDGEKIVGVIESLMKKYVNLYYGEDEDVQEDVELQRYANELSSNGTGTTGGIGGIQGFPASIRSKKELCDILTRILCHVSVHHAAVNYGIAEYSTYVPNIPTKLYNDTRVEPGSFAVYRLPNRLTSAIENDLIIRLAMLRYDTLFDYGNELQDVRAVNLVNQHYSYLMHVVQPHLQEVNRKRKEDDELTYPLLIPRWIPNGIQA